MTYSSHYCRALPYRSRPGWRGRSCLWGWGRSRPWRIARARATGPAAAGDSIEQVDCERGRESERRDDPDQLAAVLERLGHHRVREHGEDRACREGQDEGDG